MGEDITPGIDLPKEPNDPQKILEILQRDVIESRPYKAHIDRVVIELRDLGHDYGSPEGQQLVKDRMAECASVGAITPLFVWYGFFNGAPSEVYHVLAQAYSKREERETRIAKMAKDKGKGEDYETHTGNAEEAENYSKFFNDAASSNT